MAVSVTDPLGNLTQSGFDALNRVVTVTDPAVGGVSGVSGYSYDAAGNREAATDQRGLTTSYVHNGFGEVIQQSSPDTRVTVFTYDAAGNRASRTDARGVVTTWTHDALGRVTAMSFPASPAETVAYDYDDPTPGVFGIGRLASVADDSGSTAYAYDARGNITRDARVIATPGLPAQTYVTEYAYDTSDRLVSMTYPSGRIVESARDALGRVTAVATRADAAAAPVTLASGAAYEPFGPLAGLVHGNGVTLSNTFDLDGRLSAIDAFNGLMPVLDRNYTFDRSGDITGIADSAGGALGRTYAYDALHRLIRDDFVRADGTLQLRLEYGYDAVGNRLSRIYSDEFFAETESYDYDAFSNRLVATAWDGVQNQSYTYSSTGNTENVSNFSTDTYGYDATDRLVSVNDGLGTVGAYLHNAMGQRVSKTAGGSTTHFLYDLSGRLIMEMADFAPAASEYVWLDGVPLAFIKAGAVHHVHVDHLGTPQFLTDGTGAVAWSAGDRSAFGVEIGEAAGNPELPFLDFFNLRFPGQYFDAETRLHYNYFRTYDPNTGRYVESDPIGLAGGWNTYGYVGGNPVMLVDPEGLLEGDLNSRWYSKCNKKDWDYCAEECKKRGANGVKNCAILNWWQPIGGLDEDNELYYVKRRRVDCECNDDNGITGLVVGAVCLVALICIVDPVVCVAGIAAVVISQPGRV